jgi:mannose-1-phosphate guanylyltransferase / mannose-6-phosphate isomerase
MAHEKIIPLILCGGAGSRLWPLSRTEKPKQFLKFGSEFSLLQDTVLRCSGALFDDQPIIVSSDAQRFLIAEDVRQISKKADIVLEPLRRDSCAAIVAGCLQAIQRRPEAMVLVLAADHKIPNAVAFQRAVENAKHDADNGYLTTFGIKPTYAATGFGYIKPGAALREGGSFILDRFVEKPNAETAQTYIDQGYMWNSGNFLFSAKIFLNELSKHAPLVLKAVEHAHATARCDVDFTWLNADHFAASPQISVDYAVMEKTDKAAVLKVDYEWSDIGTWDAVHALLKPDAHGNVIDGNGIVIKGANNLLRSGGKLIAAIGVDDIIVVESDDAIMLTKRGHGEQVKDLVAALKAQKYKEAE